MKKIKIGLPRAFLYYKYHYLWEVFFKELDCEVISSPETNKQILKMGIDNSVDESCLSSKVYMGHIHCLINKADYILVPRVVNYGLGEDVCVKFNAMYDIVRNTFPDASLLYYNIDLKKKETELKGFIKMGKTLNKNYLDIIKAYKKAKDIQESEELKQTIMQETLLMESNNLNILLVSHPYNIHDKLIGYPITSYLEYLGVNLIYADMLHRKEITSYSENLSPSLYWTYNKELLSVIDFYKEKIDGIILVSTFPCGPDALVNELCIRKIKDVPITVIIIDELEGALGVHTRLESFIDIIKSRRGIVSG